MKRTFSILFIGSLLLVSCLKEQLPQEQDNAECPPVFTAGREQFTVPVKTVLRYDHSVEWTKGDQVGLFDGTLTVRGEVTHTDKMINAGWSLPYRYALPPHLKYTLPLFFWSSAPAG